MAGIFEEHRFGIRYLFPDVGTLLWRSHAAFFADTYQRWDIDFDKNLRQS